MSIHDWDLHLSSVQINLARVPSVVHERTPGKTASSFSTPEWNIISFLCCHSYKTEDTVGYTAGFFFFFFKVRIIIFIQASTRYLTSDIVFFSSDNEAEQRR